MTISKAVLLGAALLLLGITVKTEAEDGQGNFTFRGIFALQLAGNHEVSLGGSVGTEDVEVGFSSAVELLYRFLPNLRMGAGFEAQFGRSQKRFPGDFEFFPLYGILAFPFDLRVVRPYAIAKVGYGFFLGTVSYTGTYGDLTGGLYYSTGVGMELLEYEKLLGFPGHVFCQSWFD